MTKIISDQEREAIRAYLEELVKSRVSKKKIKGVMINPKAHWQPKMYIEVGSEYANLEFESPTQQVIAIFESHTFLICTKERGALTGLPYFFNKEDIKQVDEWE